MTVPEFENTELEKLAQMVARGFEAVDQRFDDVDRRFGDVDERFAKVEDRIDAGFKSVHEDVDALAADHFPVRAQTELRRRVERLEESGRAASCAQSSLSLVATA